MLLIIYTAVIISLIVISRTLPSGQTPLHAPYVRIINPAVSMMLNKCKKRGTGHVSREFTVLYGRQGLGKQFVRETDIRISSLVLFMMIPAIMFTVSKPDGVGIIFCAGMLILGYFVPEMDLKHKASEIRDSIMRDFPVFCIDLAILSETGRGIEEAWLKALMNKPESVFYREAALVEARARTGMPFEKSLVLFARRYGIPEIYSFCSLVGQSYKTGSSDTVRVLREYAMHSWENRLAKAREKGDKASIKMIFPLVMGLTGIILVLAYPAFAVMKGMI